jgi:hypothetical protein
MSILDAVPVSLNRETLEHHLGTMTVAQGRQAYLAYGDLRDAVESVRVLARVAGVAEDAIAHATQQIRVADVCGA